MKNKLRMLSFLVLLLVTVTAIASFLKSKPIEASEVRNLVGDIEIIVADDFENPANTIYQYYINNQNGKYRFYPSNEGDIVPNKKIIVKEGTETNGEIYGEAHMLSVNIFATPDIIAYNTGTVIHWEAMEATSCTGTGGYNGWSGPKSVDGGTFNTGKLISNKTYTITCENDFDTVTESVTVTVVDNNVYIENYVNNIMTQYTPPVLEPTPYKVGVFLINLQGETTPFSPQQAQQMVFGGQLNNFFLESSYGKMNLSGDVHGWIETSLTSCPPQFPFPSGMTTIPEFLSYVSNNSIQLQNYDDLLFLVNCPNGGYDLSNIGSFTQTINGTSYDLAVTRVTVKASSLDQDTEYNGMPHPFSWTRFDDSAAHELSHAIGLSHAKGLDCDTTSIGTDCEAVEYGNTFDIMGSALNSLHSNGHYKNRLGWINPNQKINITSSGVYSVNRLETLGGIKYAKIWNPNVTTSDVRYTVESRAGLGFDAALNNPLVSNTQAGLLLTSYKEILTRSSKLIDTTPSSTAWSLDTRNAAITGTNTFSDPDLGITIGPIISVTADKITFMVTIQ